MVSVDIQFTLFELILLASFALVALIQLIYYWAVYARLAFYKPKQKAQSENLPPVSVVIVAKNEYYNLKDLLPVVLEQDYPEYEIVVVNHASDDDTDLLLMEFKNRYSHLRVVTIQQDLNFFKGKKFPLSIGIREAKNDVLLLTDADCKPASKNWVRQVALHYDSMKTQVVLGYGPYQKQKGFLNWVIRYDTFMVAMQYLSFALAKKPYMGVGRNLSYRKSLFLQHKGFVSHYGISSGDDDLFIAEVANKRNTEIELHPDTFVYSKPKTSFVEWWKQKKRHLSTSKEYKKGIKFLLGLFGLSQLLFYALFVALLVFKVDWRFVSGIFLLRFVTQIIVHKKVTTLLNESALCIFSLLWEVVHVLIMPLLTLAGLFAKQSKWK
jgi:glycosyltransferase involved in cell wall biosynthesis